MENDNGIAQKAPVFRDKDFMLLALSMARRSVGGNVYNLDIDHEDAGRIVGTIENKRDPERPYFFELRAHFMINGVWSGGWNIFICDTYCARASISNAILDKHTVAWIKATISLL